MERGGRDHKQKRILFRGLKEGTLDKDRVKNIYATFQKSQDIF